MERIRRMHWYPKVILLAMVAVTVTFTVYLVRNKPQAGFLYRDSIYIPVQEDGKTVYEGELDGKRASFTVWEDKSVSFSCEDRQYGPYVLKEVPDVLPEKTVFQDLKGI